MVGLLALVVGEEMKRLRDFVRGYHSISQSLYLLISLKITNYIEVRTFLDRRD
jgi:hypothetical protein